MERLSGVEMLNEIEVLGRMKMLDKRQVGLMDEGIIISKLIDLLYYLKTYQTYMS